MTHKTYTGEEAKRLLPILINKCLANDKDYGQPLTDEEYYSQGYYYDEEHNHWVAYDNTTRDCWVEEFETEEEARAYATTY